MNAKETVMSLWVGEAKHINSFASPPGGYSREFLMGVCRPVLQILTLSFRQKKIHFPHPFSDLEVVTKSNITCLHKTEVMSSLLIKSISNSPITLNPGLKLAIFQGTGPISFPCFLANQDIKLICLL